MANNDDPDRPHNLTSNEIQNLLSKRLIANLATLNDDGSIHLVPMWFLQVDNDICIPTSHSTRKYRNLKKDHMHP
jgi:general stress protein 26